jgi:hypothetical protein
MRPVLSVQAGLLEPPLTLEQFHIVRGRSIEIIRGDYRKQLAEIIAFNPDHVLIHAGHNNMVRHDVFNRSPLFITAVFHMLLEFVVEVRASFPDAKIFVSTLLPRVSSRRLSNLQATQYNRLCKRFGQHLLTNQPIHNYIAILNRPFWLRISLAEPNGQLLSPDGLHVTNVGRDVLAELWLIVMTRVIDTERINSNLTVNQSVTVPTTTRNSSGVGNVRNVRASVVNRNAQRGVSRGRTRGSVGTQRDPRSAQVSFSQRNVRVAHRDRY